MSNWVSDSREDIAGARSDDPFLDTVHVSHPESGTEWWLVNDFDDHDFTLEDGVTVQTFNRAGFNIQLPTTVHDGVQEMLVAFDAMNLPLVKYFRDLRESKQPFNIVHRIYQLGRPEQPAKTPIKMFMQDFTFDIHTIKSTAFTRDIVNQGLLETLYTEENHRALKLN